jgi:hypothetical protein
MGPFLRLDGLGRKKLPVKEPNRPLTEGNAKEGPKGGKNKANSFRKRFN